ncbi:hypothetical protein MsAg5_01720 [Methanosarcinaceae archaeon Ag5]|uniref:Uncharacterized protein n=1 Tax=Methanolapillus africanus TaxID=3028297 RepID=A0AAE4MIQ1_9EURY|nr:hypothetical protein [Methanosarcinaceae archaeon Ag5]
MEEKLKDVINEQMDLVIISLRDDDDYGISILTIQDDDPVCQIKLYHNPLDLDGKSFSKAMDELNDYSKVYVEESNDIYEALNVHRDFCLHPEMSPEEFDKINVRVLQSSADLEKILKKGVKGMFNYFALENQ